MYTNKTINIQICNYVDECYKHIINLNDMFIDEKKTFTIENIENILINLNKQNNNLYTLLSTSTPINSGSRNKKLLSLKRIRNNNNNNNNNTRKKNSRKTHNNKKSKTNKMTHTNNLSRA